MHLWNPPQFENEPVVSEEIAKVVFKIVLTKYLHMQKTYAKGSPERIEIIQALKDLKATLPVKIPIKADGVTVRIVHEE